MDPLALPIQRSPSALQSAGLRGRSPVARAILAEHPDDAWDARGFTLLYFSVCPTLGRAAKRTTRAGVT
ncbi:hypothetical protein ABIB00_001828 [Bradyrhizobium sp. LB14.3]